MGASAHVVVMSMMSAVAPPCIFPMRFAREGVTVSSKMARQVGCAWGWAAGGGIISAEISVRLFREKSAPKPLGCVS